MYTRFRTPDYKPVLTRLTLPALVVGMQFSPNARDYYLQAVTYITTQA